LAFAAVAFLIYAPLITRKAEQFPGATGRSTDPYLGRWLVLCVVVFALSSVLYLARLSVVRARGRG
jgi:hypothetical protein